MFRHATASATSSTTSIVEQPKGRSQVVARTTREVDPEIFKGPYRIQEIKAASSSSSTAPWINPGLESRWLVLSNTLAAAAAQDYPASRYRVFVLDDSRHDALREQVSIFAEKTRATHGPLITYLARKKLPGVRHYFKAGNVRHGFETSAQLGRGSEMFAALDADMIVASDWLRRLVPHLIVHDRLALACPPQHFYNIPREDPLAQDSYIFARILEPLRDRLGGASCTGSGYVMRRKAIEDVGGLPLVDVGEE
ncbi:MAG: hypothetical protein LQ344_002622 [Seirophora lacunosa]|nr:MAG: hypothetical protein LQ344_002622 [Seirophora lacunosa]